MNTGAVKIVLDTNVVVSMLGSNSPNRWIFDGILAGRFTFCISNEVLLEYEEILARKTRPEVATNFVDFLTTFPFVELVEINFRTNFVESDPEDNKFVDCAIAAGAFCIVSEDKHFRVLSKRKNQPVRIFSVAEFEKRFRVLPN